MELTGHEDLRIQRTISAIQESFASMLSEMDYHRITVAELCRRARINKKTFYRYYETIDALLAEFQKRMINDYLPHIADYKFPQDIDKMIRTFFTYNAQQDRAFEQVTCMANHQFIREYVIREIMDSVWSRDPSQENKDAFRYQVLYAFWNNTVLTIYRQWIESGKTTPLEEVIELAIELTCSGLNGALENRKA